MILKHIAGGKRWIASVMLTVLYLETIIPAYALGTPVRIPVIKKSPVSNLLPAPVNPVPAAKATVAGKTFIGGPTQPESQAFSSANNKEFVDLFTGDFSYNIPLLDVGGYPLALGYNSGAGMDDEASWVGLGWSLNPGSITRNLRGLPDDFSGTDTIQKVAAMKASRTSGASVGLGEELVGIPTEAFASVGLSVGVSAGISYNNYKGIGFEAGISPSINVGSSTMGTLTAGLSLTNSSMNGLTTNASLEYAMKSKADANKSGVVGIGTGFNSRTGLTQLQLFTSTKQAHSQLVNAGKPNAHTEYWSNSMHGGGTIVSFAYPAYTPSASLPFTNTNLTFSLKVGGEKKIDATTVTVSGYTSTQQIAPADQRLALPAYGYLNYQKAGTNNRVLLDFNREKDIPYRETPAVPNIGIPAYTYDVWSITGEGTGGTFRAYRSEVGHVFDHYSRTKYNATNVGIDLAAGDLVHAGADIGITYSYTETGPWTKDNLMGTATAFTDSKGLYEAAYFRNPAEMTVNDKDYYKNIGGDDVVAVKLYQSDKNSSLIQATALLSKYNNKSYKGDQPVNVRNSNKAVREKRTQVISYLTAEEASLAGFPKYIESYSENTFSAGNCPDTIPDDLSGKGTGVKAEMYTQKNFENKIYEKYDTVINNSTRGQINIGVKDSIFNTKFSVKWKGRLKAPVTGQYYIFTQSDDGVRLFLNDSNVIKRWTQHAVTTDTTIVNLVEGQVYDLEMQYYNENLDIIAKLEWAYEGQPRVRIPTEYLYHLPELDSYTSGNVTREKRVNTFRQKNHISQIDVLNTDGRRYVYGIPVYNLKQKDVTFSVQQNNGSIDKGLVRYMPGIENTVNNKSGNDNYFSSDLTPAYAHTFLLTAVLSPDYQDLTGNGITPDDPGDAVKFNYSKVAGVNNPYTWRAPLGQDSASYNEGQRTDNRDDKGSYIYGEKELWYLNSIETKTMIATFSISGRTNDDPAIDENGGRHFGAYTRRLDSIQLYTKAEFMKSDRKPFKTVHFSYDNTLCTTVGGKGKLTLKSVWFTYNNNKKGERHPYTFHYNNNNPEYNSRNVDRWGTYKPSSDNPAGVNNSDYPYAVQDSTVAAKNVAAWALDSIVTPSGGRIKVEYESDDYAFVQNKRAAQMCTIAGFSVKAPGSTGDISNNLYDVLGIDNQFIAINVPKAVNSKEEVYARYLEGMDKLFFRLFVKMPGDKYGNGYEYVPCYATIDPGNYGYIPNTNIIWVRVKAIDTYGKTDLATSIYSPLAKAAITYLRTNLGSKAFPGSEVGDNVSPLDMIKIIASQADNIINTMLTFDVAARVKLWARSVDIDRSYVRLDNPYHKKYGGGSRVKRIKLYDHWNAMTKQRQSIYGQEYQYTTTRSVNGKEEEISSGVATYEPITGGEENPWRQPIEYTEQVSVLAPTVNGYTEAPLGEQFMPAPSVGYSKVRIRSINAKNIRSANGFNEKCFYTSYDFPTLTDMTLLADNKKRFKPKLANLLRINSRHYIAVSQGIKVELNDMNGKEKSQAMFSETNPLSPVTYSANYYRVDNEQAEFKHLNNTVMTINAKGEINDSSEIGKDVELMMDMREQHSVTTSSNIQINGDLFTFAFPPVFLLPMLLNVYNREETQYRSAGVSKIIYRHGILDSVVTFDKGSKTTARNLLYDEETGNCLLTSSQNEFDDEVYHLTIPADWAYDAMSGAYKNIGAVLNGVYIKQGRITAGVDDVNKYFTGGDHIIINSKPKTGGTDCTPDIATFPANGMMYAVDANTQTGGNPDIYFVDNNGQPFTGNDVSLKVIKSGRKNIQAVAGDVMLLKDPRVKNENGKYSLVINEAAEVIAASAKEYTDHWKVADVKKSAKSIVCEDRAVYIDSIACGTKLFGNDRIIYIQQQSCPSGYRYAYWPPVKAEANTFFSPVSVSAANDSAVKWLRANRDLISYQTGVCIDDFGSTKAVPRPGSGITATSTTTSARVAAVSKAAATDDSDITATPADSVIFTLSVNAVAAQISLYNASDNLTYTADNASGPVKAKVSGNSYCQLTLTSEVAAVVTIGTNVTIKLNPNEAKKIPLSSEENTTISISRP